MGEVLRLADFCDPWRRRMRRTAERLRVLDERRFREQIAKIEECLRRDAGWNLEMALESCDRPSPTWGGREVSPDSVSAT